MAAKGPQLRERIRPSASDGMRVRIEDPTPIRRRVFQEQRERIMKFQRRWEHTKTDLPPQLSRKHSMHHLSFCVQRTNRWLLLSWDDLDR